MARCHLSDLPLSQCGCRLHEPKAAPPAPTGAGIVATYPGWCPACEDRINPGDRITAATDGWLHVDCR